MDHIKIPVELKKMNAVFTASGYEAYLVGGAVRDMILGKDVSDWDIATNATPQQVIALFHRVIPTGIAHGTVTVHFMQHEIEVTTYRTEYGYSDGRHPDLISFVGTITEDLSRRDFTMNAIAASLTDGKITDPFDGQSDIANKIIRTAGDPLDRFTEDGLRPVRALRFSAQLGFSIQKDTFSAILNPRVQQKITQVSVERFRDELVKILGTSHPSTALRNMELTGVLALFIPELAACRGVIQIDSRGYHEFDVLDHVLYACDGAPKDNLVVRTAALFHDIGKKDTRKEEIDAVQNLRVISFHGHEKYSAEITRKTLARLKFSNSFIDTVTHLIEQHMFHYESQWTDAAVRRFIVRVKPEHFNNLIALRLADMYGMHNTPINPQNEAVKKLRELQDRISTQTTENTALSLKDIAINGKDLISLGVQPGEKIGHILNELFQTVLDDPAMNNREKLLSIAQKLKEKYGI
jgi:tRNA nucleotidyltransferase (CCA-adding enzyme)